MSKFRTTVIMLAMAALMGACMQAEAKVTVERINYRGWGGSYRLSNGTHSLVVVPDIGGRIMEYSVGGRSLIWENPREFGRTYPITHEWHNYGGYKTWPAPQDDWGFPPDPMLDFGKASIEVLQNATGLPVLQITGAASLATGILFTKEVSLDESGEVSLRQRMHNIGGKPIRHSVWDVTQVQTPCFVVFPVKPDSRFGDDVSYLVAESRNSKQFACRNGLSITTYLGEVGKIGSDSDGPWMIGIKDDLAYVKLFGPMEKDAEYPDGGCSAQVFTSDAKEGYVEMEILGPLVEIKPGEHAELLERWRVFKLSQAVKEESFVPKVIAGMRGKGWIP